MAEDAPWQASIQSAGNHICSGTILSTKYIVTNSDCASKSPLSSLKVVVGIFSRIVESGTVAGVCNVTIHPQSSKKKYASNLALLNLCEPLKPSNKIKEIQLIDKQPDLLAKATTSGFAALVRRGLTKIKICSDSSAYLRKQNVKLYDVKACIAVRNNMIVKASGITDQNICTAKREKGCSFDKGSSLVIDGKLAGVLALGDCSKKPDVFVNLFHHANWIKDNTKDN
ncbi:trypsin-1-like [Drosophila elegans]|uniref:trypsin-1-like n=1 Tax=Drosophila elegans TaxID=30023 RepID=UPI0007E70D2F|nr:trypsin-1-like [Drosophila elegans]